MNTRAVLRVTIMAGSVAVAMAAWAPRASALVVGPGGSFDGSAFSGAATPGGTPIATLTSNYSITEDSVLVSSGQVQSEAFKDSGTGKITFYYSVGFVSDTGGYTVSSFVPASVTDVNFANVSPGTGVTVSRSSDGSAITVSSGPNPPDQSSQLLVATSATNFDDSGTMLIDAQVDEPAGFGLPPVLSGTAQVSVLEPAIGTSSVPLPGAAWVGLPMVIAIAGVGAWKNRVAARRRGLAGA